MIPETKVDDTFPDGQFFLDGFGTPFPVDRKRNGGGIILFKKMTLLQKLFLQMTGILKVFRSELNFGKKKWLLNCSYNPTNSCIESHMENIDLLASKYDYLIW